MAVADVAYVMNDFDPTEDNQIALHFGETVKVLDRVNNEWWWVELGGVAGYVPANHLSNEPLLTEDEKWENEEYFNSYGQLKIHAEMLNDVPRTLAYKTAIEKASVWLKDKVMLDVGSGTGILSLFCAHYGHPKKVYSVECSDMAPLAQKTVQKNGFDNIIDVMHSKVENIDLTEQVDIIISEWMGTLLLFEFMVESVIIARNKFLKPNGVIWPSKAELFLVPCSAEDVYQERRGIWTNAYGFDFSPYISMAEATLTNRPLYNHVLSAESCLSEESSIFQMDMSTVTISMLERKEATIDFLIRRSGTLHGFASWFKVYFDGPIATTVLSTSPNHPLTHWKQDLLLIDHPHEVLEGQRIKGKVQLTRHKIWRRHLRVQLSYSLWNNEEKITEEITKLYCVWR